MNARLLCEVSHRHLRVVAVALLAYVGGMLSACGDETQADSPADAADAGVDAPVDASSDAADDADTADTSSALMLPLPEAYRPLDDEFIVAIIPDSQVYAWRFPETFDQHMRWLAEYAEEYRIVFVSHVGDIVQNGAHEPEWLVARSAYDWLEDYGVPHGFALGGHDRQRRGDNGRDDFAEVRAEACARDEAHISCLAPGYYRYFPPEGYADRPWYGGVSSSGRTSFQTFEVEGLSLLFLHMAQGFPDDEVAWANEVLDAHPGTLVHVTTHKYLQDLRLTEVMPVPLNLVQPGIIDAIAGGVLDANDGGGFELSGDLTVEQKFQTEFVLDRPNIWGIHCGHIDAEFHQVSTNVADLPVYEVLTDFQDMADGGGGWLRLLRFRPSANEVQAITFSTTSGEVRRDGDGFEHSIDVLEQFEEPAKAALEAFGITPDEVDRIFAELNTEGSELRERYRTSLYDDGDRDSEFVMEVDFQAYMDASR